MLSLIVSDVLTPCVKDVVSETVNDVLSECVNKETSGYILNLALCRFGVTKNCGVGPPGE